MTASIKSVAAHAGVAPSTVSKVLNSSPNFSVPEGTRLRIERAAAELGYVPNRMAQSLGRGKSKVLGLVITGLKNPFFADLTETVDRLATQQGYHALIETTPQDDSQFVQGGGLSGWLPDGMIVWSSPWQEEQQGKNRKVYTVPVVYLGYPRDDVDDWVAFDLYGGSRQLTELVYQTGRTRAWHITPDAESVKTGREARARAFLDVSRARGLDGKVVNLPRNEESREIGVEMARVVAALPISERPDALICHNDLIATGVFHGLRRFGIRVPEEIAVTGFDGLSEGQCLDKRLTTVSTPASAMAKSALKMLFRRLEAKESLEPQRVLLTGELLRGETV